MSENLDALHYLLDTFFIRFDSKVYRQILGIPVGTYCVPLVADLFCFVMRETSCCLFLTKFKLMLSTTRYRDDLLNIDNPYFEQMVGQIYSTVLQLNKANFFDTQDPFWGPRLVNNEWHSFI